MHRHLSSGAARAVRRPFPAVPVVLGAVIALAAAGTGGAQAASRPHASAPRTAAAMSTTGTWRLLPKAPVTRLSAELTTVWTGHEMIIHGSGVTFAYRPASRKWVRLAKGPSPLSGLETTDVAVWTGSRMLIVGLTNGSYNPATNTWRATARPGTPLYGAVTAWTGHRLLAWAGTCCGGTSHDGIAYNPASNTWRNLPVAPLAARKSASGAWTGRDLVVAGGFREGLNGTDIFFRDAAAYNPATGRWRKIAPMPRREYGATAVWDGREILFIGGVRQGLTGPPARGLAYNPATNRWRLLPSMAYPRSGSPRSLESGFAAVWTGHQLLIWGGLTAKGIPPPHGEAYTPATGKWTALPASPLRGRADPVAVWTGRQMIVWGGSILDGAAYTPAR
jgi:hypothetical protein